jgi:hypothetical protein
VQFHPEPGFLYQVESKLKLIPGQAAKESFIDRYGGSKGENFNPSCSNSMKNQEKQANFDFF